MDDGSGEVSPVDYPWYGPVVDNSLEQGDFLFDFPTVSVVSSYDEIINGTTDFEIVYYDVIVLTQSCDLAAGKIEHVLLCPFFHKQQLVAKFTELQKSDGERRVQRGTWESLYLLPPCRVEGLNLPSQIVNFRQVLAVPFSVVSEHAQQQDHRARLCPPYREHLAQAFARFIMRVGFPIEFRV